MKAVITEIRGDTAVLLSDDGCIVKVKNKNYELGQEVGMNMMLKSNFKKIIATAASLILVLGGSAVAYYTPTTYISFDVNPSIEYSANMFNRVISVKGVNDDGSKIIDEIKLSNLKNKNINDAVALTVDEVSQAGYLDAEGAGVVITTSSSNMEKAEELAKNLEKTANESCEKNNLEAVANAEAVGKDRVDEAKELGVTPGKLNLVEKLKESAQDPDSFDTNEWLNKSVKDIMSQTKQNKEQEKNANKEKNAGEDKQNKEQSKNAETNSNGSDTATDNGSNTATGSGSDSTTGSGSGTAAGSGSGTTTGSGSGTAAGSGSSSTSGSDSGTAAGSTSGTTAGSTSGTTAGSGSGTAASSGSGSIAGSGSGTAAGNGR